MNFVRMYRRNGEKKIAKTLIKTKTQTKPQRFKKFDTVIWGIPIKTTCFGFLDPKFKSSLYFKCSKNETWETLPGKSPKTSMNLNLRIDSIIYMYFKLRL